MNCKCGYSYSNVVPPWGNPEVESYAVIDDRTYAAFLKSEVQALACSNDDSKLKALARSSDYVGFLLKCPACSRLLLVRPRASDREQRVAFYEQEGSDVNAQAAKGGRTRRQTKQKPGPRRGRPHQR